MKKIIIFGDSICFGYHKYVEKAFEGIAEVYYPEVNGAFAQNVLRYLNIWKDEYKLPEDADVVHFNAGLWDVLRIYDDDTLTTSQYYGELLPRIIKRIKKLFTNAEIMFATNTAGIEEKYEPPYKRLNSDIEKFNKIAVDVLSPLGVKIDDLYELTKNIPFDSECRSDMTHFSTEQGSALIGGQVVAKISELLGIKVSENKKIEGTAVNASEKFLRN